MTEMWRVAGSLEDRSMLQNDADKLKGICIYHQHEIYFRQVQNAVD